MVKIVDSSLERALTASLEWLGPPPPGWDAERVLRYRRMGYSPSRIAELFGYPLLRVIGCLIEGGLI